MSDNNLAPAGTDTAQPEAMDDAEVAMLARFDSDDWEGAEPAEKSSEADKDTGKAGNDQQSTPQDDDPLFADADEPEAKTDKAEPAQAIEIDGEAVPIETIKEWRDQGLRQADYTRKAQALAEERRGLEAERERVRQHETDVSQALEMARGIIKSFMPQEPDYALALSDPAEYTRQKAVYDRTKAYVEQIVQAEAATAEKSMALKAQETQAERAKRLAGEREALLSHFPHLADPNKAKPFAAKLDATLTSYGWPQGSFGQIDDHRMVRVLADAARWRETQARKVTTTTPAAKPAVTSSAPARPRSAEQGPSFEERMRRASPRQRDDLLAERFSD